LIRSASRIVPHGSNDSRRAYNRSDGHAEKARQSPPEPAKKAAGPYTLKPARDRVVALHVTGQSNREIAECEQIDRETVGKILSQKEALEMIARQRCRLKRMADKALDVVERVLTGDDPRLKVPVAMKIVEHVLPKGTIEETINLANKLSPEAEAKERRLRFIAQAIEGDFVKSEKFGHPIHPKLEHVKRELDRTLEEARGGSAI